MPWANIQRQLHHICFGKGSSLNPEGVHDAGVKQEIEAVLQRGQANKEGELCVQAIFVLLDVLKQWAEGAQSKPSWLVTGQCVGNCSASLLTACVATKHELD